MHELWQDLRYGFRMLLHKPAFSAVALLSLILGIGVNTAIFTLLNAVFLHPVPVAEADTLVEIYATLRSEKSGDYVGYNNFSYPTYLDLRDRAHSLSEVALFQWQPMNLTGGSTPERVIGMFVSSNYLQTLGIAPSAGRFFLEEENETPGTHPVAVLSYACWSHLFGANPDVVGETIVLNGQQLTVVGVGPAGFRGTQLEASVDVWVPAMLYPQLSPYGAYFDRRDVGLFRIIGRLGPGTTAEQAREEMMGIARQLEEAYPEEAEGLGTRTVPLLEGTVQPSERDRYLGYGRTLIIAVSLILLIACVNVANLLLVHGLKRGREIAVRNAMGASRGRLIRQLATENLALFLVAGALSLPVARLCLELLWRFRPPRFSAEAVSLQLDHTVWAFALLTALVTGIIFGLVPAWRAAHLDLVARLKPSATPTAAFRRRWQPRSLLVISQVTLASLALIGAGVFLISLRNAQHIDLGFDVDPLAVLTVAPGEQGYDETRNRAFLRQVVERVEAIPGVSTAAVAANRLLRGAVTQRQVFLEGEEVAAEGGGRNFHRVNVVGPDYFSTVGISILQGRDFDASVRPDGPRVAIINETMAELAWPGENAIGKRFHFDYPSQPPVEVIGVASDAKYRQIHENPQFFLYLPLEQVLMKTATLHVRAEGDPAALLPALRRQVQALAPDLPIADLHTMRYFVNDALWLERVSATLLSLFALIALALALIGIYGVLAHSVEQRRRELGVRLALGGQRTDVLRAVLAEAGMMIAIGLGLGLGLAAFAVEPLVATQLHEVSATDPGTFAAVAVLLTLIALAGSLVPAWRATRTDPNEVLRGE